MGKKNTWHLPAVLGVIGLLVWRKRRAKEETLAYLDNLEAVELGISDEQREKLTGRWRGQKGLRRRRGPGRRLRTPSRLLKRQSRGRRVLPLDCDALREKLAEVDSGTAFHQKLMRMAERRGCLKPRRLSTDADDEYDDEYDDEE